jgi:hypothetical protein
MEIQNIIGWLGSVVGPAGAIVLALNIPISRYGYVLFLLSSVFMCLHGVWIDDVQVLTQNLLYTGINLIGVWRWVVAPFYTTFKQVQDLPVQSPITRSKRA